MLVEPHAFPFASIAAARYQSSWRSAIDRSDSDEGMDVSEAYELRRATAADAPAIRALTREAYAKWVRVIGREPKPMRADFDAAIRDHRVDLLCQGERVVALIETIAEPAALLIENVAVSPNLQGLGLGRRLMAHAEGLASAMGYGEIRLYANARFVKNISLYQRLGYAITRDEPFLGGRIIHMSKTLGPA
jgi:ribosomal protein S18 acetylase RimI-like enzyme